MVTHFSILAWRIPRTEKPGRLSSIRSQRVGHNWPTESTHTHTRTRTHNPSWAQLCARPWADHSPAMETLPRVNKAPLFNLTNMGAYCFLTVWTKWFERLNSTSYKNTFQNPKLSFIIKWHMNNKNKLSHSGLKTENTLHLDNCLK